MTSTHSDAYNAGYEAGQAAGSWVLDGNSSREDAERILSGYEESDPTVMEMCPSPLSGEWADYSVPELSERTGIDLEDEDNAQDYEDGYSAGYWDEVIRACNAMLS